MKKPKHLSMLSDEAFEAIQRGFNRFRFGFAEKGEIYNSSPYPDTRFEFIGNFNRKKDAEQAAKDSGGKVNPYINGKLKTGWTVFKTV